MNTGQLILGIETSCDETGAALYHQEKGLLSNVLYSQMAIHKTFGGVIPEIASRSQLEKITPIVDAALEKAGIALPSIDVIAVTHKPGLPGSLLVGVCFAKALAWSYNKKLIGINHHEGHIFSSFLEHAVPFPHVCLTASGGHTSLYIVRGFGDFELIGQTVDDAAGEAFDKVAKLLDLGYPGGPIIEKRAASCNYEDFFHYPRAKYGMYDFSFSGLKTAVMYDAVKRNAYDMTTKRLLCTDDTFKNRVASSFLVCIADIFEERLSKTLKNYSDVKALTFVGGVACNKYIRSRLERLADKHHIPLYVPSAAYCTDNGAMIAFVGSYKARRQEFATWELDILR